MSVEQYVMHLLRVARAHASKGETGLVKMNMYEAYGAVEFSFFNGTPEGDSLMEWWNNQAYGLFLNELSTSIKVERV